MLSDTEILEIEVRANAARPAPWVSYIEGRDHRGGSSFIMIANGELDDLEAPKLPDADQDFIAHARQDIPKLIEEVRRLRAELASKT